MRLHLRPLASNCMETRSLKCYSNVYSSIRTPRCFSTSVHHHTRQRRSMWMWLDSQGRNFIEPLSGSTNYLGAYDTRGRLKRLIDVEGEVSDSSILNDSRTSDPGREQSIPPEKASDLTPFPLNRAFRSQPVVNEAMREAIWEKIMKKGLSVSAVSSEMGVEMGRIGAIVRLKEIEKDWEIKGKRFAKPYAKAVMEMLPKTNYPYDSNSRMPQAHESINDLPVHAATMPQIFYPTSESREFTRTDAAKVFDETLLPADRRVPHPELAELEKDRLAGMSFKDRATKAAERNDEVMLKKLLAGERRKYREDKAIKVVDGARWDFKFREISVDDAGVNGRGHKGTGWRYGAPLMDRRKGEVKIPTRVA